jgi:hypothetical protein
MGHRLVIFLKLQAWSGYAFKLITISRMILVSCIAQQTSMQPENANTMIKSMQSRYFGHKSASTFLQVTSDKEQPSTIFNLSMSVISSADTIAPLNGVSANMKLRFSVQKIFLICSFG